MKINIVLSLIVAVLISCAEDTNPSQIASNYYTKADLRFDYPHVVSGDSVVFERYYVAEDEENIADDEYAERILFTIPTGLSSFEYQDAELLELKLDVKKYCFCVPSQGIEIVKGSISGTLKNDKWQVEANFDFATRYQVSEDSFQTFEPENRTFSENFTLSPLPSE
ncbi:MAG: hypothetical protein JXR10_15725 [Cyclobacteriaceae bacterium]